MVVSDTRYGRRKARKEAQKMANEFGRRAYLQFERRGDGRLNVLISASGRGPIYLGMPWEEVFPAPAPTS